MSHKNSIMQFEPKKRIVYLISLLLVLSLLSSAHLCFGKTVPHEIAGIRLGGKVEDYPDIEFSNYLKEVVVTDWHGFRKGIISYGICESPGIIIKIRMKYENSSKKFYKKLFKKFKYKFGEPSLWKGDSFGIRHIWKWQFKDDNNEMVSLILKHNLKDPGDDIGNVVKLSYPEREEAERLCFNQMCEKPRDPAHKKRQEMRKKTDWDFLVPR